MNFVIANSYDNYIEAHLAMGRLLDENINCWLKDENTVTVVPFYTYAVGGIKLMVAEPQIERALSILRQTKKEYQDKNQCPRCHSSNIEFISTPRKASNWFTALAGFFAGDYAIATDKVFHCFDCGYEYEANED